MMSKWQCHHHGDIDGCHCEDNEGGSDDSGKGKQKHHGFDTGP